MADKLPIHSAKLVPKDLLCFLDLGFSAGVCNSVILANCSLVTSSLNAN